MLSGFVFNDLNLQEREMDKYAVVQDDDNPKQAEATEKGYMKCPGCGTKVATNTNQLWCPNCGTEPFEKKKDD